MVMGKSVLMMPCISVIPRSQGSCMVLTELLAINVLSLISRSKGHPNVLFS